MSFVDLRLLIIFWYRPSCLVIFTIVLYVLRRLTSSVYLLVSSILSCNLYHCVVCPSSTYVFWLSFGIVNLVLQSLPLCCMSFVDLLLLFTFWYRQSCLVIFTIVLYVLRRLTSSHYLLVSSILSCNLYHCVVCPSSTYVFCLPFRIVNLVL